MSQSHLSLELGKIHATPGALELCRLASGANSVSDEPAQEFIRELLVRHATEDWGDIDKEDQASNYEALEYGLRVFSSYPNITERPFVEVNNPPRVWIITEADRNSTAILLPEEY